VERWVLGFGAEAEVLAPAGLRGRVAAQIGRGVALYRYGAGKGNERRPAVKRPGRANRLAQDDNGRG
jgi:hypothetical protein